MTVGIMFCVVGIELNPECAAFSGATVNCQLTPHQLHQLPAHGKADACAFHVGIGMQAIEGLKNTRLIGGIYTRPGIAHAEPVSTGCASVTVNDYLSGIPVIFDCITHQVE